MLIIENILWLLVLIGVMILIHELGHFLVARAFDVRVEVFSFGFGPRLFGFRRGETDFRVAAVPFGGYVKMIGEQPGDKGTDDPRSFLAKPRWQRLLIAFAGPFMNVVLAVALLTGLFLYRYPKPVEADLVATIGHVMADSPAAKAGLKEGDRITEIDGIPNPTWEDVTIRELSNANRPLRVRLERDGKPFAVTVTPTMAEKAGVGYAGWSQQAEIEVTQVSAGLPAQKAGLRSGDLLLSLNGERVHSLFKVHDVIRASEGKPVRIEFLRGDRREVVTVQPVFNQAEKRWWVGIGLDRRVLYTRLPFPQALSESARQNVRGATLIYEVLRGIVAQRMSAKSIDGPLRIAQLSGDAARQGAYTYINLMAAVSLNLAIINLLPIPILDGGVILMLLFEMLIRRDLSMPVKEAVFKFGFVFLLMVMAFVIYNDVAKMLPAG
ncbi:MAG: site-2 protease family protein [Bryobacterales bacterium]|nr:site-2 protease family protein [Bryobacterales bacterium]